MAYIDPNNPGSPIFVDRNPDPNVTDWGWYIPGAPPGASTIAPPPPPPAQPVVGGAITTGQISGVDKAKIDLDYDKIKAAAIEAAADRAANLAITQMQIAANSSNTQAQIAASSASAARSAQSQLEAALIAAGVDRERIKAEKENLLLTIQVRREELAQVESQFARTYGLDTAKYMVDRALAESTMRANPRDWVKYSYYLRSELPPLEAAGRVMQESSPQAGTALPATPGPVPTQTAGSAPASLTPTEGETPVTNTPPIATVPEGTNPMNQWWKQLGSRQGGGGADWSSWLQNMPTPARRMGDIRELSARWGGGLMTPYGARLGRAPSPGGVRGPWGVGTGAPPGGFRQNAISQAELDAMTGKTSSSRTPSPRKPPPQKAPPTAFTPQPRPPFRAQPDWANWLPPSGGVPPPLGAGPGAQPDYGYAEGTPGAGKAMIVGERGPEVLRMRPDGGMDIIPLVGGAQGGATIQPYPNLGVVPDNLKPNLPSWLTGQKPYTPQTLNQQPYLRAIRQGRELPLFQGYAGPRGIPELGVEGLPDMPNLRSINRLFPSEQSGLMAAYQGEGRDWGDIYEASRRSAPIGVAPPITRWA